MASGQLCRLSVDGNSREGRGVPLFVVWRNDAWVNVPERRFYVAVPKQNLRYLNAVDGG